mmetsp:Transcript_38251/g.61975  ORF Transcript_38251/g.61975 Transcript_38251/m.61975 type:complete len:220 (+) Transcript_38251:720-1379(+)
MPLLSSIGSHPARGKAPLQKGQTPGRIPMGKVGITGEGDEPGALPPMPKAFILEKNLGLSGRIAAESFNPRLVDTSERDCVRTCRCLLHSWVSIWSPAMEAEQYTHFASDAHASDGADGWDLSAFGLGSCLGCGREEFVSGAVVSNFAWALCVLTRGSEGVSFKEGAEIVAVVDVRRRDGCASCPGLGPGPGPGPVVAVWMGGSSTEARGCRGVVVSGG